MNIYIECATGRQKKGSVNVVEIKVSPTSLLVSNKLLLV